MALLNPSTWSVVDNIQNKFGQAKTAANSFQGANGNKVYFSNPKGISSGGSSAPKSITGQTLGAQNTLSQVQSGGGSRVDPYAAWGGQAKYQSLVDGFNSQKGNIYGSARDAASSTGSQLGRSILDFLDSQKLAQDKINQQGARNELAKQQGVSGVIGAVGRGIKSGGVMLANKNAGDSSAAGALASAYGDQGRRQLADVGNQYELGNQEIQSAQDQFGVQQASGVRNIQGTKQDAINNIVNGARDKFAQLDAAMANASLPERIAIDQERENVRGEVVGMLQQYDQQLTSGIGGIKATSRDERRAAGAQLGSAGTDLGKDAFNYTTDIPAEQQGTGPYASELPLFSLNRGKRTVA